MNVNLCSCCPCHCHSGSVPKAGKHGAPGATFLRPARGVGLCTGVPGEPGMWRLNVCGSETRVSGDGWLQGWLPLREDVEKSNSRGQINQSCHVPWRRRDGAPSHRRACARESGKGSQAAGLLEFNRKVTSYPSPSVHLILPTALGALTENQENPEAPVSQVSVLRLAFRQGQDPWLEWI